MDTHAILTRFDDLNTWKQGDQRAPHKPLLVLYALGRWQQGKAEVSYVEAEPDLAALLREFGPPRKSDHPEQPFWRLQRDGVWTVNAPAGMPLKTGDDIARVTALRSHDVRAGFSPEVQAALTAAADDVRRYTVGEAVSLVVNRNLTSTGFRAAGAADAETFDLDDVAAIAADAAALGASELCIQGRLPDAEDPRAYLGVTVPDFPNLFCLYGPNTNLGHGGSIIFHTECQVRYVVRCLREMLERGMSSIEVRRDVHDEYNDRVDAMHANMVWSHAGMSSWYKNAQGRVTTNSPWRLVDYWKMTEEPDLADYHVR